MFSRQCLMNQASPLKLFDFTPLEGLSLLLFFDSRYRLEMTKTKGQHCFDQSLFYLSA